MNETMLFAIIETIQIDLCNLTRSISMNNKETTPFLSVPSVPNGKVDVVIDTDAYNEIDDQFALAYLLRSDEKLNCNAIYAAPFKNSLAATPAEGMEKSYHEILKILDLCGKSELAGNTYRGATCYLPDEESPILSDAVRDLIMRANARMSDDPLYVVSIGAITNVASAILADPTIIKKIVVVWLGGHALNWTHNREFNLMQDVAAARVVMGSGVPMVLLPCNGVVSSFAVSVPELEFWLRDSNPLCDYLIRILSDMEKRCSGGTVWSKPIWDVTAVAWLLNDNQRFMLEQTIPAPIPEYDHYYAFSEDRHPIKYIWYIHRNELLADLFNKLKKNL